MKNKSNDFKINSTIDDAFSMLEKGVYRAIETYSNVHRGTGHFSRVTTHLYEQAREIILKHLGFSKSEYVVIFCTPYRAELLKSQLASADYNSVSGKDFGLALGVRAVAVTKKALSNVIPFHTGGGTARLMAPDWIVWESAPDKFEAGTPAVINIIAFARAILIAEKYGRDVFLNYQPENITVNEILYHDDFEDLSGIQLLEKLKKVRFGNQIEVPTKEGLKPFVNLDYAASTPTFKPVWDVVRRVWQQSEETQQEIIPEVKSICAGFFDAPLVDYDFVFTSNTTEAINIAADNFCRKNEPDCEPVVITTLIEHSSNDLPWRMVPNGSLLRLKADKNGFFDLDQLEKHLSDYNRDRLFGKKQIGLVAVSGASNVLGTFNDLKEISRIVHKYGVRLLVDAAQLVAHRKINMAEWDIDYLAFSGHKVYAPFGSGALVVKKGLLSSDTAELERICSSGEENIAGIAALGKALLLLHRIGFKQIVAEEQKLTTRLIQALKQVPGIFIHGITDTDSKEFNKRGGVVIFHFKGTVSSNIAKKLALQGGIGVRYGCHCSHILVKHLLGVGPKLEKFQRFIVTLFPRLQLPGVVRVSLGIGTTDEEIDTFIEVLKEIANKAAKKSVRNADSNKSLVLPAKEVKNQIDEFVGAATSAVFYS